MIRALDRLPHWLRWVLFIPVGLAGSLIVNLILELVLDTAGFPNTPQTPAGMVKTGVIQFAAGLTITLFPARLSPKPWPVGLAAFVAGVLIELSPLLMALSTGRLRWSSLVMVAIVNAAAYAVGGGVALLLLRQSNPSIHLSGR